MIHSFSEYEWRRTTNVRRMFGWLRDLRITIARRAEIEESACRAVLGDAPFAPPDGSGDHAGVIADYLDASAVADAVRAQVEFAALEKLSAARWKGYAPPVDGGPPCEEMPRVYCAEAVDHGACLPRRPICAPAMPHCAELAWCECGRIAPWKAICEAYWFGIGDGVTCVHQREAVAQAKWLCEMDEMGFASGGVGGKSAREKREREGR